jgi:ribosomal protein S18 acetylase RimI-like enzyme
MIDFIIEKHSLSYVCTETDKDAVGFYRNYGFEITSLGEKYPGVERFLCNLKRK